MYEFEAAASIVVVLLPVVAEELVRRLVLQDVVDEALGERT